VDLSALKRERNPIERHGAGVYFRYPFRPQHAHAQTSQRATGRIVGGMGFLPDGVPIILSLPELGPQIAFKLVNAGRIGPA